ncbi:MAG TPA: outer membrane lipoprotein chaperone LolA [Burkholderiaceae bacterium]|nr:outer membrane lipoprotein chaperone LolA [Burkholderiaceae bacterium]
MRRGLVLLLVLAASVARADAVDSLRDFVREAKSGRAAFTQTVTSPDGARKKVSSGSFEFARPNRFRFDYRKPYEQLIVGDGERVWLYDVDLQQVTVRAMDGALGATPAALLAGAALERDFELRALPDAQGLQWVQAQPRTRGEAAAFQSLRVGFRGTTLAALELVDSFGQRSQLVFSEVALNGASAPDAFRFTPPKGVDVIKP